MSCDAELLPRVSPGDESSGAFRSPPSVDEYQLTTVPIAIGAGRSPFADLEEHLELDVVEEERFRSGALAQILVPKP